MLRSPVFIIFVALLALGVHYFVYRRLCEVFALEKRGRRAILAVMIVSVVAMAGGRALKLLAPSPPIEHVQLVGSVLVLTTSVVFVVMMFELLVRTILRLGVAGHDLVVKRARPPKEAPKEPELPRRELIGQVVAGAAVAFGGGTSLYSVLVGRHDYDIEEVPIRLAKLPPALDGFTIVQLSDLHLGLDVGAEEIDSAVELVSRARPDLIVITGDLLDHDARYVDDLGSLVRRLGERAPVAAIPGNHDYYAGIEATLATVRRAGARVLFNESMLVEDKLVIAGVDDVWSRRIGRGPDVVRALANTDPDMPRVLLCHNPLYFEAACDHVDLQLSGHTHGGQFSPGINLAKLVLAHGWVRGRYERARGAGCLRTAEPSQIYVNRGFGTAGPPARIGSAPEVTRIVLTT